MMDWVHNLSLNFGAKYIAEDTASYILYKFDRGVLSGGTVPMERFARYLGLDVRCEYLTGDCVESLGVAAFEPQRLYGLDTVLDLPVPTAVVERDVIEKGESGLYNFTLALMCSEMLYFASEHAANTSAQLSFGFESVPSRNRKNITLSDAFDELAARPDGAAGFALKLLFPKNGFKRQTVELYAQLGVNRATLDTEKHLPHVLSVLSERYVAPEVAVLARLRELNLY